VLVRNVEKGSRAEKAGFRAGDLIVKVNDEPVHDTSDFTHAVHSRGGNSVSVGIIRDKREQNLNLNLPERKDSGDLFNEESFDAEPLMQAQSALALMDIKDQLAKVTPDLETAARKQAEDARKMAEQLRASMLDQEKQLRQQIGKQQEQFRKEQEKLRQELDHMRQQYKAHWFDI
ncbi:MAG TPA: PDZ domain-containing protein, partial [Candidatus Sulfotelmatobacter sp.]|nr:PDZ domain-containing protein [Candidatus Sulfotelmatobacter sp.]